MLCSLPAISSLVQFVSSDGLTIMVASPAIGRLLQTASALSIVPIMVDLAARRHIHWTSYLHHVLTCLFTVVCVGWSDAASVGVFYCTTCYFAVPLEYALGFCAMEARVQICVWWLTFAKWTSSVVFALGQVGIVTSMYKIFKVYVAKPNADTAVVSMCFALGLLVDVVLNATQWYVVRVMHEASQIPTQAKEFMNQTLKK